MERSLRKNSRKNLSRHRLGGGGKAQKAQKKKSMWARHHRGILGAAEWAAGAAEEIPALPMSYPEAPNQENRAQSTKQTVIKGRLKPHE
jgi:hypothetical protein